MDPRPATQAAMNELRWAHDKARRWNWVYWPYALTAGRQTVLVASVTPRLIELVEQRALAPRQVAHLLAMRAAGDGLLDFTAYGDLYLRAVYELCQIRADARAARAHGLASLAAAERGDWAAALRNAVSACALEAVHSGHARYWGVLLAALRRRSVQCGYGEPARPESPPGP